MTYHIEPVENAGKPVKIDWLIELEVGDGLARNVATIADLTRSKTTPTAKGTLAYRGAKTLALPLDEQPTTETAFEVANEIALALLEAGKSRPSDLWSLSFTRISRSQLPIASRFGRAIFVTFPANPLPHGGLTQQFSKAVSPNIN
jgi:hypothetical protein